MIRSIVISQRHPCEVTTADVDLARLRREFPTVEIESRSSTGAESSTFEVDEWRAPGADLAAFDARVANATTSGSIGLVGPPAGVEDAALQVLTRYQGLIDRRNEASATRLFDRVVASRLEQGDDDRAAALDVWQWTLRLAPRASLALQLAALFRDAPLVVEPEQREPRGAPALRRLLAKLAVPTPAAGRACGLLLRHDDFAADPELRILDDAAALSFFSRRSDAALRDRGLAHTRSLAWLAVHRLRPAARVKLLHVRLLPEVWRIVEDALRYELGC